MGEDEFEVDFEVCGECDQPIEHDQPSVMYDGYLCHLHCAAEAEDEAFFDRDFLD